MVLLAAIDDNSKLILNFDCLVLFFVMLHTSQAFSLRIYYIRSPLYLALVHRLLPKIYFLDYF